MIDFNAYEIFKDNFSTLKKTSKDDGNGVCVYMTESGLQVVNFDKVMAKYSSHVGISSPWSNDALCINRENGRLTFIEFKNGKIKPYELQQKIYDSLLVFTDIIGAGIKFTRKEMDYILVYNGEKNSMEKTKENDGHHINDSESRYAIAKTLTAKGGEEFIGFGLNKFKGYCFKDVHTYSAEEFEEKFVKLQNVN